MKTTTKTTKTKTTKTTNSNGQSLSATSSHAHPIVRRIARASHVHLTAWVQGVGGGHQCSFGSDNIHHFADWFALMQAKLVSGAVTTISLVVGEFDHEPKVVGGSYIPRKRVCGCSITDKGGVRMLSARVIEEAHTVCSRTGRRLPPEPGVEFIDFAQWMEA